MNAASLASVAARRSGLYWLLAEIFLTCPNGAFIERLRRNLTGAANDAADDLLAVRLVALRNALPGDGDTAGSDALAVEYTRLFGGIKAGYGPPPPYESVQRKTATPTDLVVAAAASYAEAGFAVVDEAAPADHLGVELKFVALLCHGEFEAWQHGRDHAAVQALDRQREFLDDHLLQWAPDYWRLVQAQARHDFYRELAALALQAVSEDRAQLEEMLTELDAA